MDELTQLQLDLLADAAEAGEGVIVAFNPAGTESEAALKRILAAHKEIDKLVELGFVKYADEDVIKAIDKTAKKKNESRTYRAFELTEVGLLLFKNAEERSIQ